ncbi:MAG: ABC transporter substrate-binding protein [Anaerolineae bacterium]
MDIRRMNRRQFITYAGLAASAVAATACGATPAPAQPAGATEAAPTTAPAAEATTAPAAPAATASRYKEAPMLAEMVAAGQLPPVEERLPKDPMVIEPLNEVGKYGGRWRRANTTPGAISARVGAEPLVFYGRDWVTVEPNLASRWEVNDEGTEYTFYLREGVRWSDGAPFTADDIMFWWEDVTLNEEITPAFPTWLKPGGEPAVVEKLDDYTIKFTFAVPYGIFLDQMCFRGNNITFYPKHYLQKFHAKYADADELAQLTKERGFDEWFQLFAAEVDLTRNPDLPTVRPWQITSKDWTISATGRRNPYYWKVDTEGNQLPYIDEVMWWIVNDAELIPLKVVSGEIDELEFKTGFVNYTLYMENREKGDYQVGIWDYGASVTAMHINQTKLGNDEQRDILRNRDFRLALSKAFDREDMNQLLYLGQAGNALDMLPESVKSDPEIQDLMKYDVDEANRLLDSIGLDKRDADGFRLLPSGEPLTLLCIGTTAYATHRDASELIGEFWAEVGIRLTQDWFASELWSARLQESTHDVIAYEVDYTGGNLHWLTYPRAFFPIVMDTYWAPMWGWYYDTGGQNGEPPEGDAATLVELWKECEVTVDAAARKELEDEAFRICAYNLWPILTLGSRPEPCIVKNGFKNVPEWGTLAWAVYGPKPAKPEQFFWDV